MISLVRSPSRFFAEFSADSSSWIVSSAGYYLISLAQTFENLITTNGSQDLGDTFLRAISLNLTAIPLGLVFWGFFWLWLPSRLLGGHSPLGLTAKAIGYAFLLPGAVAAPVLVSLQFLSPALNSGETNAMLWLYLGIALPLAFWSMALCWKAVRTLNSFSTVRTLCTFALLPGLLFVWVLVDEFVIK